ncbi:hypothetical protein Agub_g207, partial [Astrephomene gubernaculifera]
MSCALSEEELAALEAEAAERRAAASGGCGHAAPCEKSTCQDRGNCDTAVRRNAESQGTHGDGSWARGGVRAEYSKCMKCKTANAVVLVRQREPLCKTCLETGISGKVRALKSHKLMQPRDHIAIAFSGGSSSQALLCNVLPMRKHAATPRKERGKIEFDLTVIHINEAAAFGLSPQAAEAHARAVLAAAQQCGATPPAATVLVLPLSDVFLLPPFAAAGEPSAGRGNGNSSSSGSRSGGGCSVSQPQEEARRQRQQEGEETAQQEQEQQEGRRGQAEALREGGEAVSDGVEQDGQGGSSSSGTEARDAQLRALLQAVPDPTGREDLVRLLRGRLLAGTAGRLGATKLLRADSGTALAARVIADTAKGRGYSLPGDIQLVDARGAVG